MPPEWGMGLLYPRVHKRERESIYGRGLSPWSAKILVLYGDVCEMTNSAFDCNVPLVYVVCVTFCCRRWKKRAKRTAISALLTLLATWPIAYSRVSSCCIVSYWGRQMRCQYRNYDRKREVTFCTHTEWEDGQNRPKCRHVAKITIFLQDTDSTGNKNPAKLGPDIVPFCVVFICII